MKIIISQWKVETGTVCETHNCKSMQESGDLMLALDAAETCLSGWKIWDPQKQCTKERFYGLPATSQ